MLQTAMIVPANKNEINLTDFLNNALKKIWHLIKMYGTVNIQRLLDMSNLIKKSSWWSEKIFSDILTANFWL